MVCTGPLTFLDPCKGVSCAPNGERLMSTSIISAGINPNTQYLGGTFTVEISELYNKTTGLLLSPPLITAAWMRSTTGLNITLTSAGVDSTGRPTATPLAVTAPLSTTFYVNLPGYGDPLLQNATDRKVYFGISTATKDGGPWECGGLNCPIYPSKSAPIKPHQAS